MSYARSAVTRMTLDMSRPDLQRSETVTQGDTNRRWEVTLTNGGAPFRLPPNWTAALTGIKPDGTGLLNGCSVADGKIIYDFAAGKEIATCVGSYPVQFDIWDEVGELVASPKVYVNVLADARPHAELESNGQYTLIGDAIKKITDMEKDVDLLGDTALAQGDDIAALKKKVTTAGSVTIPASEWTDTMPKLAFPEQPVLVKGTVALLMPSSTDSQNAARKAKITVQSATYGGGKIVIQREDGEAPTGNITLDYIIIKVDNPEAPPKAALIGVDAYGEGGGTASGVDESAVKSIIKQVMPVWTQDETPPSETDPTVSDWAKAKTKPTYTAPEVGLGNVANVRQYSADNPPPYPVTSVNGQVGSVNLPIPSEAADVRADPAGTAEAEIKNHNTDNAAHEYIQQRIDALRTLVENFLDIDDESFDQLSEILRDIRANTSALELLGTNKVDKTAISTSMTDSNPEHVASMALIVALDNALTVVEQAIEDLKTNKQTAEQVSAAINNALSGYLTSVKADETYQPAGDYPTTDEMGTAINNATKDLADKTELNGIKTTIEDVKILASQSKILFAESVEWLKENGDTTKTYVLPDGYIYAYMTKAEYIEHNVFDGTQDTILNNKRVTGLDTETNGNGYVSTKKIKVDNTWPECVVTIKGMDTLYVLNYAPFFVYYYDDGGSLIKTLDPKKYGLADNNQANLAVPVDGLSFNIALAKYDTTTLWPNTAYVRFELHLTDGAAIYIDNPLMQTMAINIAPLNGEREVTEWTNTGLMLNTDQYGKAIEQNTANIAALQTEVARLTTDARNRATPSGAVYYAVGDSITAGYGLTGGTHPDYNHDKSWVRYVRDYNGYSKGHSLNLGISGLGFCRESGGHTARTLIDATDFSAVDLVTIALGINDWKTVYSLETMQTEMRYCIQKIMTDNPYCKIVFIAPFNCSKKGSFETNWALGYSGSDVTGGITLQAFIDLQKAICEEYGVQVVDINKDGIINKYNINSVLYDTVHPDEACHKALGRELAKRIMFA